MAPVIQPRFLPGCPPDPAAMRDGLAAALVAWFRGVARAFPWRGQTDPYAIWVSEVMLQQTTTAMVVPYFERFMREYPSLRALAKADDAEVLRQWEGLGYYRRCRALLAAARRLVELGHDNLPDDPDLLISLPGMGEYTRNAVLSQAFGRPVPIVEANSRRVLARLFGMNDDPARPACARWLWGAAAGLVPLGEAGAFNQALMELGGLVCQSNKPSCLVCPARPWCRAAEAGQADAIPLKTPRPAVTRVAEVGLALRHRGAWLLRQCPEGARRGGLWEFPRKEIAGDDIPGDAARKLLGEITGERAAPRPAGRHGHSITRYRVTVHLYTAELGQKAVVGAGRWVPDAEMPALPMSAPHRRMWRHLGGAG